MDWISKADFEAKVVVAGKWFRYYNCHSTEERIALTYGVQETMTYL